MSKARDGVEDLKTIDANLAAKAPLASPSFTGNVGIGTSSPDTPLDVTKAGGGNFVAKFQNTTAATPYGVSIKDAASGANGYPLFQVTNSSGSTAHLKVMSGTGDVILGGTVTKPLQPSFSAYLGNQINIAASTTTIIPLNQEEFDVGNNFNTSNNRFVAPVTGKYLITAAIQYAGAAGTSHSNIYINGGPSNDGWVDFGDAKASTQSRVFSLAANDYVQLVAHIAPNATISGNRAKLTGFLIG